jgi:hypothetical protein
VNVYVHTVWAARAGEMNRFYKNDALPGAGARHRAHRAPVPLPAATPLHVQLLMLQLKRQTGVGGILNWRKLQ